MNQENFTLILHAGNSKSSSMEAIEYAREGMFAMAEDKLKEAQEELNVAHRLQYDILHRNVVGTQEMADVLLMHANDHVNAAIITYDLSSEFINLYEMVADLKKQVVLKG